MIPRLRFSFCLFLGPTVQGLRFMIQRFRFKLVFLGPFFRLHESRFRA